jgi:hypothetical protein
MHSMLKSAADTDGSLLLGLRFSLPTSSIGLATGIEPAIF